MDKIVCFTLDLASALDLAGEVVQRSTTTYLAGSEPHVWPHELSFAFGVTAKVHHSDGKHFLVSVPDYHASIFTDQLRGAVRLAAWETAR